MLRQGAGGPDPSQQRNGASEERDDEDENSLKDAPVFVPAGGFGELFQHGGEEALEVELLVDAQGEHQPCEH